jgi:hypothetical protein
VKPPSAVSIENAKLRKIASSVRNAHSWGKTYSVPKGDWRKPLANGAKRK